MESTSLLNDSFSVVHWGFLEVLLSAVFVFFAFKCTLWIVDYQRKWRIWSQIPSAPESNYFLGHVLPLARSLTPWHVLINWLQTSGHSIVRFRIFGKLSVILDDPYSIKRVFQSNLKAYPKDVAFSYGTFLSILGTGIITSDGAKWQKQRLLIAPAMKIDALESVIPASINALKRLQAKLNAFRDNGESVDIAAEFRHLTLQVIGETILSLDPDECDDVLAKNYLPIMEECNRRVIHRWRMYVPSPAWCQQERRLWILNGHIKKLLRKRWHEKQSGDTSTVDLLDKMMLALQEQGEIWTNALEDQMCYEIKSFLLAGHETSAAMLAWALYELLLHPEYLGIVRREADELFTEEGCIPQREKVEKMEFTLCVLKEVLRKYTIVPAVCRELAIDQDELCDYKIPKGTMIVLSLKGVHQKYKDPQEFIPERFLPGNEYESFPEDIRHYMFLPFIQGPRNCLGQYFALLESRVVLAYVVKYYEFSLDKSQVVEPGDVIPEAPKNGLNLLIKSTSVQC